MVGGGWVLDCTRLMLISTQVEVVVELKLELSLAKTRNDLCAMKQILYEMGALRLVKLLL